MVRRARRAANVPARPAKPSTRRILRLIPFPLASISSLLPLTHRILHSEHPASSHPLHPISEVVSTVNNNQCNFSSSPSSSFFPSILNLNRSPSGSPTNMNISSATVPVASSPCTKPTYYDTHYNFLSLASRGRKREGREEVEFLVRPPRPVAHFFYHKQRNYACTFEDDEEGRLTD